MRFFSGFLYFVGLCVLSNEAYSAQKGSVLAEKLNRLRAESLKLQGQLLDELRREKSAKDNLKKIKTLMLLQQEEQKLGSARLKELESTIVDLEDRRRNLLEKVRRSQLEVRLNLRRLDQSRTEIVGDHLKENALWLSPKRKLLSRMSEHGFKEVETLRIDLDDAEELRRRIEEERNQVLFLLQDIEEQKSVLELNRQLQADVLQKNQSERLGQIERYRSLKVAENRVESLIQDFNARMELEQISQAEKKSQLALSKAQTLVVQKPAVSEKSDPGFLGFGKLRGRLSLPVRTGKILTGFGKVFDEKSRLQVFKKGLEIAVDRKEAPVLAVAPGKVVFSGELPDCGRVAIVDHGDHFYSLVAHLGSILKRQGDGVTPGEVIATSDAQGSPIYFEIRSRNVAVNPLQWLSN